MIQSVLPVEYEQWKSQHPEHQVIDVRESYEYEDFNIGGLNIPMENVLNEIQKIPAERPILFCCKSGKRSAAIAFAIERKHNYKQLFTLSGGIEALLAQNN